MFQVFCSTHYKYSYCMNCKWSISFYHHICSIPESSNLSHLEEWFQICNCMISTRVSNDNVWHHPFWAWDVSPLVKEWPHDPHNCVYCNTLREMMEMAACECPQLEHFLGFLCSWLVTSALGRIFTDRDMEIFRGPGSSAFIYLFFRCKPNSYISYFLLTL